MVESATHTIPAEAAARMPESESSKTTHSDGLTPVFSAASRNVSGDGLWFFTSSCPTKGMPETPIERSEAEMWLLWPPEATIALAPLSRTSAMAFRAPGMAGSPFFSMYRW